MTSPAPLLYATYYHIYNRGVNRENIFVEERNYALFLNLFEKHLASVVDLFACCMLRNHFHVLVRVKSEEVIKTLKVSVSNLDHLKPEAWMQRDDNSQGKPLGFDYPSRQFSNFFNAYAKTIHKTFMPEGIWRETKVTITALVTVTSFTAHISRSIDPRTERVPRYLVRLSESDRADKCRPASLV